MADIESPETFAERVRDAWVHDEGSLANVIVSLIRARDAAVRREALAEAAAWCAQKADDVREVTRDCRREAIALKASGKDWKDAFDRECLSSSRCSGFEDAEKHFRVLAESEEL